MTKSERILLLCQEYAGGNMSTFARQCGVTPAYISKLKNNPTAEPSDIFIKEVCRQFNVNETWLLSGDGDMHAPIDKQAEIASIAARLFKDDQNSFRYQLIKLIAQMDEDQMKMLKDMAVKLAEFSE